MSQELYYTPPTDAAFEDMKQACIQVWEQYKDSPGGYMEEKVSRIRELQNVGDNFMYMFAMLDIYNQSKAILNFKSVTTMVELENRLN